MGVRTLGNILRDNDQLFDECRKLTDERNALKARVAELEAALQEAYEVASGGNGKSSPMIGYWGRLLAKSS